MFNCIVISDEMKRAVGGQMILWQGKPEKKCAVFQMIFNPMFIFALIITAYIVMSYINGNAPSSPRAPMYLGELDEYQQRLYDAEKTLYAIKFYAFRFLPIIPIALYVTGILISIKQHNHAEYVITDRGVFTSKGIAHKKIYYKSFREIYNAEIKNEITDSICKTGTILIRYELTQQKVGSLIPVSMTPLKIKNIPDYLRVCGIIKENMRSANYV